MRIDHVALFTEDLERMRAFYCGYFGGRANSGYRNPRTGLETYFLTFDGGAPGTDAPPRRSVWRPLR